MRGSMAILKASYTKSICGAKASIRYMQHRPGRSGEKITRTLFGCWDGAMTRRQAYQMVDEAHQGSFFFRFVISPDPKQEDTLRDLFLREMTERTMHALADRFPKQPITWVAVTHADHAPNRHVHVLVVMPRRLQVKELQELRLRATTLCLEQRFERDHVVKRSVRAHQDGLNFSPCRKTARIQNV